MSCQSTFKTFIFCQMSELTTVAFRVTWNLKSALLPVNYWSWKMQLSELQMSCQQWELTFLSTVAFSATKILLTVGDDIPVDRGFQGHQNANIPVAFRATYHLEDNMLPVKYQSWQP